MEDIALASQPEYGEYVADALEAVQIKFVDSFDGIADAPGFPPEFAHQHFGETEKILGYENLSISVCYSDAMLFIHPIITYDSVVPKDSDLVPDDIVYKIRDTLAVPQLDSLITDPVAFEAKLREQESFQPPGELISTFSIKDESDEKRVFQLYKQEGLGDKKANSFLERAQSLAFWYIDAVCYTDYEDPRFFNYFIFESTTRANGLPKHTFVGYATLYRFYHFPDLSRVRIAQIMIAPSYRHAGIGSKFLSAIYDDLFTQEDVFDITFEDPADSLLLTRHFVDCSNCCQLPEFSKENMLKGFKKSMREAARKNFKLHSQQARRVYEILRLAKINMNSPEEMSAYKANVCKRLERPLARSDRDFNRLTKALNTTDMAVVMQSTDPEYRKQIVDGLYADTLETYKMVIERLRKFNPEHF